MLNKVGKETLVETEREGTADGALDCLVGYVTA